jgi:hypothetical protein
MKGKKENGRRGTREIYKNIFIIREFRGRIWKPLVVMDHWQNQ